MRLCELKPNLTKLLNPRSDCGDVAFTLPLRAGNYWPPVPVPCSYEPRATLNIHGIGNKLNSSGKLLLPEARVTSGRRETTPGRSCTRGGRRGAAGEFGKVECVCWILGAACDRFVCCVSCARTTPAISFILFYFYFFLYCVKTAPSTYFILFCFILMSIFFL